MNMLGWSTEAGNPNIQDLKENWQKHRETPRDTLYDGFKFKLGNWENSRIFWQAGINSFLNFLCKFSTLSEVIHIKPNCYCIVGTDYNNIYITASCSFCPNKCITKWLVNCVFVFCIHAVMKNDAGENIINVWLVFVNYELYCWHESIQFTLRC